MKTTDLGHDTTEVKIETNGDFFFYFAEISLFFSACKIWYDPRSFLFNSANDRHKGQGAT